MSDPDDSTPFTHRPYGAGDGDNPFTSPSGASSQDSGPSYQPPEVGPVPYASQPPPPYGTYIGPQYGTPYLGAASYPAATRSMVLGIVGLVCLLLTPFCCITLPGLLCSPFAWVGGARARRDIDEQPGVYANRAQAQAGYVMGIIGTALGVLMVVVVVAVAVWIGVTDFSLV